MSRFTLLPLLLLALPMPLAAQDFTDLDQLTELTATTDGGIAAAREQARRGMYLEALATLERVMATNPRSGAAQLLHAVYLCRIDDRQGGNVEIDRMDVNAFGQQNIDDARQQCSRPYVEPRRTVSPPPAASAPPPPPVVSNPGTGSTPASQPIPPAPPQGGKD